MKQEIVLPKFKLPGQTNWLMRGLWIAGAVVLVQAAVVAVVLSRRSAEKERIAHEQAVEQLRALAQQAQQAAAQAAAQQAALSPPSRPVQAAPAAPHTKESIATAVAAKPGARVAPKRGIKAKATAARSGRAGRVKASRQGGKLFAKSASSRPVRPKAKSSVASKGGDDIDAILRKFK